MITQWQVVMREGGGSGNGVMTGSTTWLLWNDGSGDYVVGTIILTMEEVAF